MAAWRAENASQPASRRAPRHLLAGLLGTRPETLSRTLREIEGQGAIRHSRSTIEVVDRLRLRSIARRRRGNASRFAD